MLKWGASDPPTPRRGAPCRSIELWASYCYHEHPFDVAGWDGYVYPYAFNIHDFEATTRALHTMPPYYQAFEAPGVVICNFVPRPSEFRPEAIPAPPSHGNIDCEEIMYGISGRGPGNEATFSYQPAGSYHGPKPGAYEGSIGTTRSEMVAFMVDTFRPLQMTTVAREFDDAGYMES